MERFVEFISNHPFLTGLLALLVFILVFSEKRRGGRGIAGNEVVRLINREGAVVLDVRSKEEFSQGHIAKAVNVPYAKIVDKDASLPPQLKQYKDNSIIVVDASGQHAGQICANLKKMGIENVVRLESGINGWRAENLPLV